MLSKFGKQKGGDDIDQPRYSWAVERLEIGASDIRRVLGHDTAGKILAGYRDLRQRELDALAAYAHRRDGGELRKAPW